VTDCIDKFSKRANAIRFAAIIGGEAVIMHGIPRTTIDLDMLFYCGDEKNSINELGKVFASFLKQELGKQFEIKSFEASKDPFDPLKHDLEKEKACKLSRLIKRDKNLSKILKEGR